MQPLLEPVSQTLDYGDLPETWRVPEIERFSIQKTLYDYQEDALKNAARVLYLYYGNEENDYRPPELPGVNNKRKQDFARRYADSQISNLSINRYDTHADRTNQRQNPVFRILSEFLGPQGENIPCQQLINRMCFWMATGSGKTLVMVKLVEYLHRLKERGEIPPHNVLILAPGEHLVRQIRRTVEEFNQSGLEINLVPLREGGKVTQARLGDRATVFIHRSDNVSDVQKEALIDYRRYENDGKWYVLLDEAHKGGKEGSKRQAYYAVMAREGFLFNFSATFTDPEDIVTTVKKYNLEEFTRNGHGKNIYLNERGYEAFRNRKQEISHEERRKIALKSLITLAYVALRVKDLRAGTGLARLYHLPLMLTLVNSVNTGIENESNDLWAFFQTLREIATGEIDELFFSNAKNELADEWTDDGTSGPVLLFGDNSGVMGIGQVCLTDLTIADLREQVFLSHGKSALQLVRSRDNKELAFQMKNAAAPFALIRIGDTSKWRHQLLAGFEETRTLQETSFFDDLEKSGVTILMGSRSFFESWDSNRPNVINFINIGGTDAKKFVVQSVGRGVRIETLPGQRRRCAFLPDSEEKHALQGYDAQLQPPETLFLFATNRAAVRSVLEGLRSEKSGVLEDLEGFVKAERPKLDGKKMPLLVPEYKGTKGRQAVKAKFTMSAETLGRLRSYIENTSDSVFLVRDNLATREINNLRKSVERKEHIRLESGKNYSNLPFLQNRLNAHLAKTGRITDGMREIDENNDIVHFRNIRAGLDRAEMNDLRKKINAVAKGAPSAEEKKQWARQFAQDRISDETFMERLGGKPEESFKGLKIKNVSEHYYVPVVTVETGRADFIKHVIKENSEVRFFNRLEEWLKTNTPEWDTWTFSKIDESYDTIHIPYYDSHTNEYTRFFPDFIFWMFKGGEYQVVFVDPKGTAHKSAYLKIDGYRALFEKNNRRRTFRYRETTIHVGLLMFNEDGNVPDAYSRFWTGNPADIFARNSNRLSP